MLNTFKSFYDGVETPIKMERIIPLTSSLLNFCFLSLADQNKNYKHKDEGGIKTKNKK